MAARRGRRRVRGAEATPAQIETPPGGDPAGFRFPVVAGGASGRCQALPGFGHPAARPAAGGLAKHLRELALGDRLAVLDAGAVGRHCGGLDVAVRADSSHSPLRAGGLVRHLVRVVRHVPFRSTCLARARDRLHGKRAVRAAGRETSIQPNQVSRSGVRSVSISGPAGTPVARLRPAVVRGCSAGPGSSAPAVRTSQTRSSFSAGANPDMMDVLLVSPGQGRGESS
jgi:hypothetical protein